MAIAYSNSAYAGFNGAAVSTVNYTVDVGSGTDRFLIVAPLCVPNSGTADILTSITYNGTNLTKAISEEPQTSGQWIGIWYLKNPSSGSNTLTLNASANWGTGGGLYTHWACYTGVTGTPIIDVGTAKDELDNSITLDLTTTGDNAWLYSTTRSIDTGDQIAGAGTTERTDTANSTGDSNGAKTPTGSYSMGWTTSGSKLCGIVIAFAPEASGGATPYQRHSNLTLMGV